MKTIKCIKDVPGTKIYAGDTFSLSNGGVLHIGDISFTITGSIPELLKDYFIIQDDLARFIENVSRKTCITFGEYMSEITLSDIVKCQDSCLQRIFVGELIREVAKELNGSWEPCFYKRHNNYYIMKDYSNERYDCHITCNCDIGAVYFKSEEDARYCIELLEPVLHLYFC